MEEEELLNAIAMKIREIRKSKGLSQMDVAAAAGIDKSAYQRIERGGANITIKMLNRVLEANEEDITNFFCTLQDKQD